MAGFLAVCTQLRGVPLAPGRVHWTGLDYAAAQAGLSLAGLSLTPEAWNDLRLIEAGAIEEMNRVR